jgi:hypothetical protein
MTRVLMTLSVLAMLTGCGRTPLNESAGTNPGDAGQPDGTIPPQDAGQRDRQEDAPYLPDGPRYDAPMPDGPQPFDGPRFDGPRPDGPRFDGPRPDGGRQDGPRPDAIQFDAPPQSDAAGQSDGSTPGQIECGNTTCDASTQECCTTAAGPSCIAKGGTCYGSVALCDGPEDCNTGEVCCGRNYGSSRGLRCATTCNNGTVVCHLDSDCGSGERCCGTETIAGYSVTTCTPTADCPNTGPGVVCGSTTCPSPQICCVGAGGSTCTAANACSGTPVRCDGPEDCSSGTCCGSLTAGSSCVTGTTCANGQYALCHVDGDCPSGTCHDLYAGLRVCY